MISLSDKMPLKFIRIRNAPSQDASISILYVQETGIMTADHAKATKINHFNSYLFIYVLNGSGTIEFENGDIRKISAGQCTVMDCRYLHSYKCDENEPWELLWVHFNGVSAQYYFSKFENKKCNVFTLHFFHTSYFNIFLDLAKNTIPPIAITTTVAIITMLLSPS